MAVTKRSALAVAVATAALATGTAHAQLEEVVVTAQKREQGVNDVPISITALSPNTITNLGVRSLEDIAVTTPGLYVNQTSGTGAPAWTIRGVGFQDYSTAASSTVGLYFDEVAFPYPVMGTNLFFDVGRVEVLKGPQGDLYGRNTTGGQIGFYSARPTDEFEAGFIGTVGNFATIEAEGFVSGPLAEGVRGRAAFKTVHAFDGWQESITRPGDELGEKEIYGLRGILEWDVTPDLSASFIAHYNNDQSDSIANTQVNGLVFGRETPTFGTQLPFLPPVFGQPPRDFVALADFSTDDNRAADWTNGPNGELRPKRDNQQWGVNAKFIWDVGAFEVTSITAYESFSRDEANDWDGSGRILDSSNINVTDIWVFSQELRVASTIGDDITWLAGVYYANDEVDEDYNYFFGEGAFGIAQLDTNYTVDTESIAVFGHAEWDINERFGLNVGARFTNETREFEGCTFDATPPDLPVPGITLQTFLGFLAGVAVPTNGCGVLDTSSLPFTVPDILTAETEANEWMWKAGVDFTPNEDILAFFNISRGFKSGGFNGANLNTVQQLGPYDIETLTSYELGIKATLLDGSMQADFSVFYYDYEDKQERGLAVTPVGNISGLINIPESNVIGLEGAITWYPVEQALLQGSFSWLETNISEYEVVTRDSFFDFATFSPVEVTVPADGEPLANAPRWSANVTASYDFMVGGNFIVTPAIDVIYRGKAFGAPFQPEQNRDQYMIGNLRMSLQSTTNDRWKLTAWSRNFTDTDYFVSAFGGGNVWYVRTNGMPRTYGATLEYRFE